jgi:MFS family permease
MNSDTDTSASPTPLKGISLNTLFLGLVSLLHDVGSGMVEAMLPVFIVSLPGATAVSVGWIEGVAQSASSLLKPVSGWLSDKFKRRRPAILFGYWIATFTRPLLAVSGAVWQVLFLRLADRVGKGARTAPRDALIADSTEPRYRGRAFGLQRAMDNLGAVLGPLAAVVILKLLGDQEQDSLRKLFWIATIPGFAVIALVVWGLKEPADPPPEPAARGEGSHLSRALTPNLIKWYVVVFVFWFGNSADAFLILKAKPMMPVWQLPLLMVAMNGIRAAAATPAGALSDRVGRRALILTGWICYALVYLGFALANSSWMMFCLFGAYGLYYALTEGAERALVADLSSRVGRATALGVYHFAAGVAALPASLVCGWLWVRYSPRAALGFGAACALLGCVLLVILNPRPAAGSGAESA